MTACETLREHARMREDTKRLRCKVVKSIEVDERGLAINVATELDAHQAWSYFSYVQWWRNKPV